MNRPITILRQRTWVLPAAIILLAFLSGHASAAFKSLGEVNVPTDSSTKLYLRLWVPDDTAGAKVRGVIVTCHPSGSGPPPAYQQDYRPSAKETPLWNETFTTDYNTTAAKRMDLALQLVAKRHNFALVGLYFTDQKPGGISAAGTTPADVSMMPAHAAALEAGLNSLASTYSHPELATAPIITYGFSGGSGFAAYYAAYRPSRCIAFAHNKGGSIGDVTYTVKASIDLATWSTTGITETVQPPSGNIQ
ncbi:MAG: hypothetical protein H7Y43_01580, partial [Akkermansiaceae bacterium]|nr:hypothetical protein [Verrucomicrobiales bacterium]